MPPPDGDVTVIVAVPAKQSVDDMVVVIAGNGGAAPTVTVFVVVQLPSTAVIVCLPGAALNILDA